MEVTKNIQNFSSISLTLCPPGHKTHSAAASVIPWAFFEESMTPIQMYKIIYQYK